MSAIERRTKKAPIHHIEEALKHVNNEKLPIPYKFRMELAEILLRAKHFGKGGGLKKGQRLDVHALSQDGIDANGGSLDSQPGD